MAKGTYSGSAHDLQLFLDEFIRLKPEPVALTLLKARVAQLHPSQVRHRPHQSQATFITDLQLFLEFYYRRETRPRVRLEALRALGGICAQHRFTHLAEIVEHVVLPYLVDLDTERDATVLSEALEILCEIAALLTSQTELWEGLLAILTRCFRTAPTAACTQLLALFRQVFPQENTALTLRLYEVIIAELASGSSELRLLVLKGVAGLRADRRFVVLLDGVACPFLCCHPAEPSPPLAYFKIRPLFLALVHVLKTERNVEVFTRTIDLLDSMLRDYNLVVDLKEPSLVVLLCQFLRSPPPLTAREHKFAELLPDAGAGETMYGYQLLLASLPYTPKEFRDQVLLTFLHGLDDDWSFLPMPARLVLIETCFTAIAVFASAFPDVLLRVPRRSPQHLHVLLGLLKRAPRELKPLSGSVLTLLRLLLALPSERLSLECFQLVFLTTLYLIDRQAFDLPVVTQVPSRWPSDLLTSRPTKFSSYGTSSVAWSELVSTPSCRNILQSKQRTGRPAPDPQLPDL